MLKLRALLFHDTTLVTLSRLWPSFFSRCCNLFFSVVPVFLKLSIRCLGFVCCLFFVCACFVYLFIHFCFRYQLDLHYPFSVVVLFLFKSHVRILTTKLSVLSVSSKEG